MTIDKIFDRNRQCVLKIKDTQGKVNLYFNSGIKG